MFSQPASWVLKYSKTELIKNMQTEVEILPHTERMQDLRDVLHIEVNNHWYEVILHDDAPH